VIQGSQAAPGGIGVADDAYRRIVESAVDFAIIAIDTDGVVTDWSAGARHTFGWTAEEMKGATLGRIFTPEDLASDRPGRDRELALSDGRAHGERWYLDAAGRRFWGRGETQPLRSQDGRHVGYVKIIHDETEKRHVATELREARNLSDLILRSSRDCIVVLDLEGRTLEVSPGGIESMEISDVQAILGLSWLRVWQPETQDAARAALEAAKAGGVGRFQGFCPTHQGKPRWWDVVISPLPGADGAPERLVTVGRDITENTLAQIQFRAVAEAVPNHVWTAQPDGLLDWFNAQVYAYSGAAVGELDGAGWAAIVHPEDLDAAAARWAHSLATESPYEAEFRLRRRDGAYRWHIARAMPIRGIAGAVARWVGTNTDIEDQRSTQAALAAAKEFLEEQVELRTRERDRAWRNSQDLQAILDVSGVFLSANDRWSDVLGWRPDDIVGRSLFDFIHEDDLALTRQALAADAGRPAFESRHRHQDGGWRWIAWVAVHDGDSIFASGRHVTAEKQAAAELSAAQEQLRRSQKMEAVGQLTGGVAHDFNNILQVIAGNLHLLSRFSRGDEKMAQRVASAQDAVRRGAKLSSQLLAFSRRQPLSPKVLNAGKLVAAMEDLLRRAIGDAVEVELVVSGGLWNTLADPTQIENAILNLAINARDAMQGRGKLTIEVGNAELDDRYARQHSDVTPGQYVMLAVSDTGSGMTPEVAARAFEPFFSTKMVGAGTGLGLSMIYGFVKQSGGHVKIYSEVGAGTTIRMYLPRSMQREEVLQPVPTDVPAGGEETVLVAEDDEGVRATVVDILRELGYRVLEARDADSAMNVVDSGIAIDLLFTDVVMPGSIRSTELARRAQNRLPNLRVLFTSGYTQNAIVHGGRLDAGVELLVKPYQRDDLARKVRQVLGQAKPAQPGVPQASATRAQGAEPPVPAKQGCRILVVEDDEAIRLATVDMLRADGHQVFHAADAEQALSTVAGVGIELAVVDLHLPGMDGAAFVRELLAAHPATRIVLASGTYGELAEQDSGTHVLLPKPYDLAALRNALKSAGA
jgi:PAS domain S-box-containing protein